MADVGEGMLKGQVAVVTGAGRGIGRAVAERLASRGARIVVADLLPERIERAAAELVTGGAEAIAVQVDTGSRAQIDAMMARALDAFGRIDILVNNAGIARGAKFLDTSREHWDDHIRINLGGIFHCSQAAGRVMAKAGYGRIVSIASVAGLMGPIDLSAYGASKAGVIGLTRAMALELAEHGITANAIAPGPIDTELLREAWTPEAYAERARHIPAGRLGQVNEIAHAVEMLVSPEAAYISGVTLPVDGGSVAAGAYMVERYRRLQAEDRS
ncbi:SDR family NAD(P)-dependent oxidoreductase [Mesorhizobium sp. ASY16-5R]|uniref:SDR family NAD(P)-dependent oxidoreductase n=1 Tax=Mesorhizobium sp. ASY16-5R TaxID=3445772 RepID=UPI003F9F5DBC